MEHTVSLIGRSLSDEAWSVQVEGKIIGRVIGKRVNTKYKKWTALLHEPRTLLEDVGYVTTRREAVTHLLKMYEREAA